ncbi:hypothetical protein KKG83_00810 [Candidatus Micrarchaeota archaeon]|nr:hypothetical protein [Candidatus Micrarchaeota archaeon]MBU2475991.1 hypothetical protein [Candidatus Micrarchaeota archaeon]
MFWKNKNNIPIKFTLIALILGFTAGFFSVIYLSSTGNLLLELNQKPCFKYTGENPDSFCDEKGNLHVFFKGDKELNQGWYTTESDKCVPCNEIGGN